MIAEVTKWFVDLVIKIIAAIWDFFGDIVISIVDSVLTVIGALIKSIPAPSFLSQYSLSSLIGALPSDVLFFVSALHIGQCFTVIGLGFAFRMTRKIFTLGQW